MKRTIVILCALALLSGLVLGGLAYAEEKGKIHIKFSTWHPPASREVKTVWIPMLEELKKRSNGRITYTLYAGGALGKGPEHFDIVRKGMSDMGYFTATWTPGRFPLTDVLSMAAWVEGKDLATDIGNKVYKKILKDEFKDVKVLELNGCIQSFLWTTKPVHSLADLKGLKLPRWYANNVYQSPRRGTCVHASGRRVPGHGDGEDQWSRDLSASCSRLQTL